MFKGWIATEMSTMRHFLGHHGGIGIGHAAATDQPRRPAPAGGHLPCIETRNYLPNFWQTDDGQHHSQQLSGNSPQNLN